MNRLLAFAASSSINSINKKLVIYSSSLVKDFKLEILDLNDFELPLFSVDIEKSIKYPDCIKLFINHIKDSDLIFISFAEHNGSYTAVYKNLYDWCSRLDKDLYKTKRFVLLSTSPGYGGGKRVLTRAIEDISRFGGIILGSLSLPSFTHNFDVTTNKIKNLELDNKLKNIIHSL